MDFEKFRRTGELSDITIIVDKTEFKLHTFPLFTKSDYFKQAVASTTHPYIIRLDNDFPGGADIFNQLADYFYSIPIPIDHKNIIPLRSAACFIQCDSLSTLIDQRLDEILSLARRKYDLGIPLILLEQSTGEYQQWAKQAQIIDRCFECIIENLARGAGLQLCKSDRELIVSLPLEWIVQLINLCPNQSKLAILPLVKHCLTINVLEQNEREHQSAFTPVRKKGEPSTKTDQEKRTIIDEIIKALGETFEQYPLLWMNSVYEKAIELKCETESILASYITQTILSSNEFDHSLENIPDDVMTKLLERVSKHKDDQIKDPQLLSKLSTLIDSYVQQLRQRGTLTSEQFIKLASCIPKENRSSHDSLLLALDQILKDEKSTQLNDAEREELLNQIDFSRVSEETIATCKTNQLIPQQLITDAALALCVKLRKELEETQTRLNTIEKPLNKNPHFQSKPFYRSRPLDSSFRIPNRTRSTISHTSSNLSRSNSIYDRSNYLLSSRYLSSASTNRFCAYPTYRY